jgi:DNA-binding response OmpR family regulator
MPYLCLIIEPDEKVAEAIQREFPPLGCKPCIVPTCEAALVMMRQWRFDAVVLDGDAIDAPCPQSMRRLQPHPHVPLMLLSSRQDEQHQIAGLESGATEIVVKPASARLVGMKLRRLIEVCAREPQDDATEVVVGPLVMHPRSGHAAVGDVTLALTTHQFDLLLLLASRAGEFVPREMIARALRGPLKEIGRSADVHIYRIRKKLRKLGIASLRLDTVYGRGYCLSVQGSAPAGVESARLSALDHLVS